MKKIFGVLLAVATLVLSDACASSGASGKPEPTDSGENWVIARPVEQPRSQSAPDGRDNVSTDDANGETGAAR